MIQPQPRSRLFGWWQVTAGALSGVLIVAALAVVFLAAFIQPPPTSATPRLTLTTTSGQRAAQLPSCHSTRGHPCGRKATPPTPKPTLPSGQRPAK